MGESMREKGYRPALVLCSTAKRAGETLKLVLSAWSRAPEIRYERALYLADWPGLLHEIRKAPGQATPLLLVGHNPALQQLALALALKAEEPAERARLQALAQKFPAGALAVLDFAVPSWAEVGPGLGRLVDLAKPKDLG